METKTFITFPITPDHFRQLKAMHTNGGKIGITV